MGFWCRWLTRGGCFVCVTSAMWADVPFSAHELSLQEQVGQLFIIPVGEEFSQRHLEGVKQLVQRYRIGGILLKQGTVEGQQRLVQELQALSVIPLLCFQDAEWGVGMRLRDVKALPKNLTLGAVQDLALIYRVGQEIGAQCREVKTDINLAPVVDVNTNPRNPIIYMRSFGEDPEAVAQRALQVSLGIQSMGVLTCAKHFPGHGSVSIDSHCALPIVDLSEQELMAVDLIPFQRLIDSGVEAVLSAHVSVPSLIDEPLLPATFSRHIVHSLLRQQMKFSGLIITDALNMKAIGDRYSAAEIATRALGAGHDLLLYGDHVSPLIEDILFRAVPEGIEAVQEAVDRGAISKEELFEHVERILAIKRRVNHLEHIPYPPSDAMALKREVFQKAVTLLKNQQVLPLQADRAVIVECGHVSTFAQYMEEHIALERFLSAEPVSVASLDSAPCVILVISCPLQQLPCERQLFIEELLQSPIPVVAVILGSPYWAADFAGARACLVAYENDPDAQRAAADVLLGKLNPEGRLPVSSLPHFHVGDGMSFE